MRKHLALASKNNGSEQNHSAELEMELHFLNKGLQNKKANPLLPHHRGSVVVFLTILVGHFFWGGTY